MPPQANRGPDLVQIEVKPGIAITPESLFDARLEIVRTADLKEVVQRAGAAVFLLTVTVNSLRRSARSPLPL